jgi:hypothetical protein
MKRLFVLLLLSFTFFMQAQIPADAAKEKPLPEKITPPQKILEKFTKEYPGVTPSWRMDGQNFMAEFVDPLTLKGCSIVYDKDANVLRRENEMENSSYPQSINDYYIKKFPGEKFKTWSSLDTKGERSYFIKREKEIVWFDKEGKPLEAVGKN